MEVSDEKTEAALFIDTKIFAKQICPNHMQNLSVYITNTNSQPPNPHFQNPSPPPSPPPPLPVNLHLPCQPTTPSFAIDLKGRSRES